MGLRFLRELEQGKKSVRLDKVNQVLQLFGHEVEAVPVPAPSDIVVDCTGQFGDANSDSTPSPDRYS